LTATGWLFELRPRNTVPNPPGGPSASWSSYHQIPFGNVASGIFHSFHCPSCLLKVDCPPVSAWQRRLGSFLSRHHLHSRYVTSEIATHTRPLRVARADSAKVVTIGTRLHHRGRSHEPWTRVPYMSTANPLWGAPRIYGELLVRYYHEWRTHLSLNKDCPETRPILPPAAGKIVAVAQLGGLHHRYERRAG
jgi:hypothetical protein